MKNDFCDRYDAVMNRPLTPAGCAVFLLALCLGVTVTLDYAQRCDIRRLVVSRDAAESRCRELSAECDARANDNMTLRVQLYDARQELLRDMATLAAQTNRQSPYLGSLYRGGKVVK